MELIKNLKWRYAVKQYTNEKVSEDKIDQIIEAINLTASSTGIQPYRLYVISDLEIKKKLAEGSFNKQIETSSHLLVFAALKDVTTEYVMQYILMMEQQREMPSGSFDGLKDALIGYFPTQTPEQNAIWATKQAYIALGTALVAAAELEVDATPMEGFDVQKFDEILGLSAKGLQTSVILSLGYRDEANDYLAGMKKVRLPISEFVTKI